MAATISNAKGTRTVCPNRSLPGEIDVAPIDSRAISIRGCFVVVEGVCVTAVAVKRLP